MDERLWSLDVLRSAAIMLVLTAHIVLGYGAPALLAPLQLGGIGVDLFFVLSGWLLGGQIFKELSYTDRIDIKRFWLRRWIRTLPAYYVVLALLSALQLLTKDNWALPLDYLFFLQNYHQPFELFHVSWSLAVEEQFYLIVAPAAFLLWKLQRHTRLIVLLLVFSLPSVFRYFSFYENLYQTHVRIDGCIAGVLLAYVKVQLPSCWNYLENQSRVLAAIASVFFFLYFFQRYYQILWLSDPGIVERALIFSAWIVIAVSAPKSPMWRIPGSHYIATRSYSLYLLHPIAIAMVNRIDFSFSFPIYFSAIFGLSLILSEILYKTVEVPSLKFRDRINFVK